MTDYLMSDDAYIQQIANPNHSITQSEENALNILAVADMWIKNDDLSFAREIMFKYLERIAYNRLVMEYALSLWKEFWTTHNKDRLCDIWTNYFYDGRYGDRSLNRFGEKKSTSICQMYSINKTVHRQLVHMYENSTHSTKRGKVLDELRKCVGYKQIMPEQEKLPQAYEALSAEYVDDVTIDV